MILLVWQAMLARRAQALSVLVLTMLAVAAAMAAPWYVLAAAQVATATDVSQAPAASRVLSVTEGIGVVGSPRGAVDGYRDKVSAALSIPGLVPVLGLTQTGQEILPGGSLLAVPIGYRDGICQHVAVTGSCPSAGGEALLTKGTATVLGVAVGQTIQVEPRPFDPPVTLRIVGTYQALDPTSTYWAITPFGAVAGNLPQGSRQGDPILVSLPSFGQGLNNPTVVYDAVIPDDAIRGAGGFDLSDRLTQADYTLRQSGISLSTGARGVAAAVAADRRTIGIGVVAGAVQLLALCWFALYLAGRYTARQRRGDVALLKLRGVTARRNLALVAGQSAAPTLGGLVLGAGLGYLAARLIAGPVTDPDQMREGIELSGLAVLVAVVGALASLIVAELGTLGASVAQLLRQVPPRRRPGPRLAALVGAAGNAAGGGAGLAVIADLVVIVIALAGAYQAKAQATEQYQIIGLAQIAPGLVAVAVALILARLFGYLAGAIGTRALHTGRVRLALGALQVSRRPGTDRVFALIAIAVALLGTAANSYAVADGARADRAAADLGAPRVLTVRAANRTALLSAVRAADPGGRDAMAVVYNSGGIDDTPPTLAVDTSRFAAITNWRADYGNLTAVLDAVRPSAPGAIAVTGTGLTVDAASTTPAADSVPAGPDGDSLPPPRSAAYLRVTLASLRTGTQTDVLLGPVTPARGSLRAPVSGCATTEGCRLVSLAVVGPPGDDGKALNPGKGASVTVYGLGQTGPDRTVAGPASLGDIRRWRESASGTGLGLVMHAGNGRLTLAVADEQEAGKVPDHKAYPVDGPVPLPVVVAGDPPSSWLVGDTLASPFSGDETLVRVAGTAAVLPMVGRHGMLVDLDAAQHAAPGLGVGDLFQVWLSAHAPKAVLDSLRTNGMTIFQDVTATTVAGRLNSQGPSAAVRFALWTAGIGLLLAAATVAVSGAVERGPRADELTNLRAMGLPAGAVKAVSHGGSAALVGLGVLAGLLGTVLARLSVSVAPPVFVDTWTVLPVHYGLRAGPLLAVAAVALLVIGVVAAAVSFSLVRATVSNSVMPRSNGGTR